ncbi:MAG: DUF1080 domain-containing protein [Opitutaceae bacterium]|nr:DUF1080 domain-containing protein [Opitutaceae bacterium]
MLLLAGRSGAEPEKGGWEVLFDGRDLAAWQAYGKPSGHVGWVVEEGTLASRPKCGDLVSRELYGDFELELEWRISPGGNSGVMFRVDDSGPQPWHTGPEMQVLDDQRHKDGKSPLTSAGALYALYAPARAAAKPVGEWNAVRIRAQGARLQFWLNGVPTVDVEIGSADWNARVAASKFADKPRFGRVAAGRILLQDHKDPVWYRNIRIRRL